MTNIYDQHRAAFSRVSAFVILKDGERVATIALKYPRDGAGRLYAYVHLHGESMVRAYAGGGGYDKASAAISSAIEKLPRQSEADSAIYGPEYNACLDSLIAAAKAMDAGSWARCIESQGFTVLQAV